MPATSALRALIHGRLVKTPAVVSAFFAEAQAAGYQFEMIRDILSKVEALGTSD
jgi:hypothetical protein